MSENRQYSNPVQRGFFPDPSVIRVGEDYYMVNSSFQYFPAIPISHSRDLVHWHIIGHGITNPEWLDLGDIRDSHGIWAPDISYVDGKFYIFAPLRLNGDGARGNNVLRRQLVMVSDRPEGPYSKPVCLEVDSIDPSHFVDDDGSRYLITAPGISVTPLTPDSLALAGETRVAWPGTGERCPEGPHMLKKDGWYYAILAEGGTGYGHRISVARSRELFGEYECCPYNPVMRQLDPESPIQRAGHGSLVEDSNGQWWCAYLCGRPNGGRHTTVGRETALDPVQWTEDGWFTVNGGRGPSLVQRAPELPETVFERNTFDGFDSDRLGMDWEFVRTPDNGSWSLTERPGWLRIWTRDGLLSERRAKNTLVRREQELSYRAETKLEFSPDRDGEQAGLCCYYSTATYIRFALCCEGGRRLQLVANRGRGEELVAQAEDIPDGPVLLAVEVEGLTRRFLYSVGGGEWRLCGTVENCVFLCDEGVPEDRKRHTGTLVGIYANNGGCGSRKAADFDYFSYRD